MIKAGIFDMDGLLIDSEPFWHRAHIETAYGMYGLELTAADVRKVAGRRTIDIAREWQERAGLNQIDPQPMADAIIARVIGLIAQEGRALPGAISILEMFKEHGVPVAIASSATPDVIDAVVERLELTGHISFAYSAIHEPKGKPDPGVFLTTAKRLNVEPEDCAVFEDAVSGLHAAKAAGMKCVVVPEVVNQSNPEFKAADLQVVSLEIITWDMLSTL